MAHDLYSSRLQRLIAEENENWTKIFENEINQLNQKDFSSGWWRDYYKKIIKHVKSNILSSYKDPRILEPGSGSGKATILLGKDLDRTLLDISSVALKYAKVLAKRFKAKNIKFIEGNIFNLPFNDSTYDLVWNIGVVEHYQKKEIEKIVAEMLRVTNNGGTLCIAFPNFSSGPIIKARLLKIPFFKFIKGYRIGSEKYYQSDEMEVLINKTAHKNNLIIKNLTVTYFGNPLPMETHYWLLNTLGRLLYTLFPQNRFLIMVSGQIYK